MSTVPPESTFWNPEVTSAVIVAVSNVVASVIVGVLAVYLAHRLNVNAATGRQKGSPVSPDQPGLRLATYARRSWLTSMWATPAGSIGGSAALGLLLGVTSRALREVGQYRTTHVESLIAIVVMAVFLAIRALWHRRCGTLVVFQTENLLLWGTYVLGWSIVEGSIWDDLLIVATPWWLGCSLVGGWISSRTTN